MLYATAHDEQTRTLLLGIASKHAREEGLIQKEQLETLLDYAKKLAEDAVDGMLSGERAVRPAEKECDYCPYAAVCGFDPALPGCRKRAVGRCGAAEFFERIGDPNDNGSKDSDSAAQGEANALPLTDASSAAQLENSGRKGDDGR